MIRRYLDLIVLFVLAVFVVVFRLVGIDGGFALKFAGTFFVLFAPGYAVVSAVFKEGALETPAKIALGIGISLAISAVGGIFLYGIGAFLTMTSWIVFLGTIILLGLIVALIQRSRNQSYSSDAPSRKLAFSELALAVFSIIALSSGVYLAQVAEQHQAQQPFTEFWVGPQTSGDAEIEIGLHNNEQTDMAYAIIVEVNGIEVETWKDISVLSGENWQTSYQLPAKGDSEDTIVVTLYTDKDLTTPYRWVQFNRE